jgi:hypothetical protein
MRRQRGRGVHRRIEPLAIGFLECFEQFVELWSWPASIDPRGRVRALLIELTHGFPGRVTVGVARKERGLGGELRLDRFWCARLDL